MNYATFQERQPLALQAIANSIRNRQFAHAYILYGSEGVELQEYGEFLIQSLLCENPVNGLACGLCGNCSRVARGVYADLVVLSGSEKHIGKGEIIQLINQLNKTGLESKGLKFYLINEVDNATVEALNSLLKFLEEPGNELTYAILTTHQLDKVLPTITSRCLKIPFWGYPKAELIQKSYDIAGDNSAYYLLSNIAKNPDRALALENNETFKKALQLFRSFLGIYDQDSHEALVIVQTAGLNDKKSDKELLSYWLALNIQFFKDINYTTVLPNGWYHDLLDRYNSYHQHSMKMLPIFLEAYDQLERPLNLSLLVEKMFWQLKELTS